MPGCILPVMEWLQPLCGKVSWPKWKRVMQYLAMVLNNFFLYLIPIDSHIANFHVQFFAEKSGFTTTDADKKNKQWRMYSSICYAAAGVCMTWWFSHDCVAYVIFSFLTLSPQVVQESEVFHAAAREVEQLLRNQNRFRCGVMSQRLKRSYTQHPDEGHLQKAHQLN